MLGVPTPSPTPTPKTYVSKKGHYTIALLGDSMIDTLGVGIPNLKTDLTALFPATTFTLLNFGVGGTNIDYGLTRLTNGYTYLNTSYPSVISTNPDIVVVESFAYNPYSFDSGALEKHWTQLATIVDMLRNNLPGAKIIIAATIAPNSKTFGDGAPGISLSAEEKIAKTTTIKQYLHSTVQFAKSSHLPLVDAYDATLDGNGDGLLKYINPGDHIHYSQTGRVFFTQKIADTIIANNLLE